MFISSCSNDPNLPSMTQLLCSQSKLPHTGSIMVCLHSARFHSFTCEMPMHNMNPIIERFTRKGRIVNFISQPGTFTLQQSPSWRQLEAYNYFKNNYVRTVFCSVCNGGRCVVVKAKVNPSQKSPDLAHDNLGLLQERKA